MEESDREFIIASGHNLHIRYFVEKVRGWERKRERGEREWEKEEM